MPDPASSSSGEIGWIATLGTILGIALVYVLNQWFLPLWKSIFGKGKKRKSTAQQIQVEGYGYEVRMPGLPNFAERGDGMMFQFSVKSGTLTVDGNSVSLEVEMDHTHIDGQRTTAMARANGIVAGNFSYIIYSTQEHHPASGRWTGCAVIRLSASGESVGIWLVEDIYEPGKYMTGNVRFWPKGSSPRPATGERPKQDGGYDREAFRTPLPGTLGSG